MKTYTITEGKAQLSALVEKVLSTGESVVIGRNGKPMVELKPYEPDTAENRLGAFAGKIKVFDDFDQWGDEEAKAFGMVDE